MPSRGFLHAFDERVRLQPNAPALSWGDHLVSYQQLAADADSAAALISGTLGAPTAPVCVPARKSPKTIALVIACLRAGLRILQPAADLGGDALDELCRRAGCTHLFDQDDGVRLLDQPSSVIDFSEPGLLLTTSGSTGVPKTVVLSAAGVDRFLAWAAGHFTIANDSRVLSYAPLNFDLCLLDVWAALAAGACVELVDQSRATDGRYLGNLLASRDITHIQAVPMFYRLLADATADAEFDTVDHVAFTGDAMPLPLLARLPKLFPRATLTNIYGCTETNDSFIHEVRVEEAIDNGGVPIGRPIDGVDARIIDESGEVVHGVGVGELVVTTPFQAIGYQDEQRTAEKWRGGYFHTGDLVRRDERNLVFLAGRNDHQVKVRGVRTNLHEVEQVILAHSSVLEAAVVAVPDAIVGNRIHAVIRRRPETELNSIAIRSYCAKNLPRTAIPGVVEITETALPRTATGKIDRNVVRASRAEGTSLVD
jgi:acyl-coenzyme A synthetase/AMP-(fatty) acid ligase